MTRVLTITTKNNNSYNDRDNGNVNGNDDDKSDKHMNNVNDKDNDYIRDNNKGIDTAIDDNCNDNSNTNMDNCNGTNYDYVNDKGNDNGKTLCSARIQTLEGEGAFKLSRANAYIMSYQMLWYLSQYLANRWTTVVELCTHPNLRWGCPLGVWRAK